MGKKHSFTDDTAVENLIDKLTVLREKYIELESLETQLRQMEIEVRSLSIHDDLTGVFNIRGFISLTEQQIKLADRTKTGILILYVVVSNQHLDDQVLIGTADILKSIYRDSDIVSRVSDDEFMVVLISAIDKNANLITGRLKRAVEAHNCDERSTCKLSIRFGVLYYDPEKPCTVDELLDRAVTMRPRLQKA